MIRSVARSTLIVVFIALMAPILTAPAGAASAPPPVGKYACYNYGFNFQAFYNGVTLILKDGSHYTTQGATYVGRYRYLQNGSIVFASGKLQGLTSRFRPGPGGKAILIDFRDGRATNTAVCGMLH
ncbi:MAG: hypothetical protein HKL92_08635 [Candidatus Eremiobacteraeota bacterium]|nr:hypothetical protein [Candidatus Eremiobacteraeota bacterium]NNM93394.1 hypothetical protein [Candidatus Eremiobacteraeota bacterium]